MVKLHLGCGPQIWPQEEGWINVDLPDSPFSIQPDVKADARELPFEDNYADEVHAIHLIEHFYYWDAPKALREWKRVLKPGGLLVLELPDIEKVLTMWANGISGMAKTWFALYGDPRGNNPLMSHHWCYSFSMIKEMLEDRGFEDIIKLDPKFHFVVRDMRVECRKRKEGSLSIPLKEKES